MLEMLIICNRALKTWECRWTITGVSRACGSALALGILDIDRMCRGASTIRFRVSLEGDVDSQTTRRSL